MHKSPYINHNKAVALTSGDPNSIAPLITLKAWLQLKNTNYPFFLISNNNWIIELIKYFKLNIKTTIIQCPNEAGTVFHKALPIMNIDNVNFELGKPSVETSPFVLKSLDIAIDLALNKNIASFVTNPIDKNLINTFYNKNNTPFLGHTGYIANKVKVSTPIMMMASKELNVIPITTHISLQSVATQLTSDIIEKTAYITHNFFKDYLGKKPKILFLGLNPHCGENRLMGTEEQDIIIPTLKKLSNNGLLCFGPQSADTAFSKSNIAKYDIIMGMYHDQVLAPFKTLYFDEGVNVTLGLPFIRTSPDHGVAFDIAKQDIARPDSLVAAISMAHNLSNKS